MARPGLRSSATLLSLLLCLVLSAETIGCRAQYDWIGLCYSQEDCEKKCEELGYHSKDSACEPDIDKPINICGCRSKLKV